MQFMCHLSWNRVLLITLLVCGLEGRVPAQIPLPVESIIKAAKVVPPSVLPASTATVAGAPPVVEGGFTIMVLPDTQYYTQQYPETFHKQTQWIADNAAKYNVPFVVHLGDITETAADAEWEVARAAFARLDGRVAYLPTPGNHDYGGRLQVQTHRSPYSNFFPVSHFQKMATFGGVYDRQPDKSDNQYHVFQAGGRKWLVLALEYGPRNDVLRWAGEVCASHPEHSVIITTHAYLDPRTNRRFPANQPPAVPKAKGKAAAGGAPPPVPATPAKERPDLNQGEEIWQKLASRHRNIALVLCGHASYTSHAMSTGNAGNTVHEVVVDYQRDVNGGNGWMRLLQFLPDGKTVRTRDYSPLLDLTCTMQDRCYDMVFELPNATPAVVAAAAVPPAPAAPAKSKPDAPNPTLVQIQDTPGLPRVLIIGDSISMGYTLPVRRLLEGKANVHRIPQNGGPTKAGMAHLDRWLGEGKWDVIHFNWGIHDLKFMPDGKRQVETAEYEANLRALVAKMKATGAQLVWATTTPIPEGELIPPRRFGQVAEYNQIAARVMQENGVAVDDLNAWITPDLGTLQRPQDVHFTADGSERLAKKVAEELEKALGRKPEKRS